MPGQHVRSTFGPVIHARTPQHPGKHRALSGTRQKGKTRLEAEIRLIESWLSQLDGTRPDNTEMLAARKNYGDMLQSRRDLLQSLQRHKS